MKSAAKTDVKTARLSSTSESTMFNKDDQAFLRAFVVAFCDFFWRKKASLSQKNALAKENDPKTYNVEFFGCLEKFRQLHADATFQLNFRSEGRVLARFNHVRRLTHPRGFNIPELRLKKEEAKAMSFFQPQHVPHMKTKTSWKFLPLSSLISNCLGKRNKESRFDSSFHAPSARKGQKSTHSGWWVCRASPRATHHAESVPPTPALRQFYKFPLWTSVLL